MLFRRVWIAGAVLLASTSLQFQASAAPAARPAPPPVKPVTETHFGTKVTDNYRYMEDEKNAAVTAMLDDVLAAHEARLATLRKKAGTAVWDRLAAPAAEREAEAAELAVA